MSGGPASFHVMAKPSGPLCNLDCKYCFYLDKESLFASGTRFRMSDEVLAAFVRQQFESQRGPEVVFAWQGGEPTLMRVEFFERAVALRREHSGGRTVQNAFQTNGVLLDDAWGGFLKRERFLVGLSLDGPAPLHDAHRLGKAGKPTFERVMRRLGVLKRHGINFNTLTVVHRDNARHPLEVYRFLQDVGSAYMQFIPLVERVPDDSTRARGFTHAPPPLPGTGEVQVTEGSVAAHDYGEFLVTIFDEWLRHDVGRTFVQLFDVSLGIWMGLPSGLCLFRETCGGGVALEQNGDVFSCDHFVYPEYRLGNVLNTHLGDLVRGPRQRQFGEAKAGTLPAYCRSCDVRFACNGECPKNRSLNTPDGEPGLNCLCAAYQRFFRHAGPALKTMSRLINHRRSPAEIMTFEVPATTASAGQR